MRKDGYLLGFTAEGDCVYGSKDVKLQDGGFYVQPMTLSEARKRRREDFPSKFQGGIKIYKLVEVK